MDWKLLEEIIHFLNYEQIRATYGAVAENVGVIPQSLGSRLGPRRKEASWIVNAQSGLPTGYSQEEMHPALQEKRRIISSGPELRQKVLSWQKQRLAKPATAEFPR